MVADSVPRSRWWHRGIAYGAVAIALIVGGALLLGGYAERDGQHFIPATAPSRGIGALYISGDMGLHFDVGRSLTDELAAHGIATSAIVSPVFFKTHRTLSEVDGVIAQAVREALRRTGNSRIVAIGRSYGADILQTGLADLPAQLRTHIAAVILIVPGDEIYFRSDPTTLAYRAEPDGIGADTVNQIAWTPLTCIYGREERDSLCPDIVVRGASLIPMPGGHFLNHDQSGLLGHVFSAIDKVAPPRTMGAR